MSSSIPLRRSARLAERAALAPVPSPRKAWPTFCVRVRSIVSPIYKATVTEIISFAGLLTERKDIHEWTDEAIRAELVLWLETRCIVSWNQPIYNALIWKVNTHPTREGRRGFYRAARFVRNLTVSLIVKERYTVERLLGDVVNQGVISEEAVIFIDAFISARNRMGY